TAAALAVTFSADGKFLASGGDDRIVRIWDAASGESRGTWPGHGAAVRTVAFSGDGKTLLSGSDDATAKLWDTVAGEDRLTISNLSAPVGAVAFTANGIALTGGINHAIFGWDQSSGRMLGGAYFGEGFVQAAAFSPDGRTLATGGVDITVERRARARRHECDSTAG